MARIKIQPAVLFSVAALTVAVGAGMQSKAHAANHTRPPFSSAAWVAVDRSGHIYVLDSAALRVRKLSSSGRLLASWALPRPHNRAATWTGMVVDPRGYTYVLEDGIVKLSPTGRIVAHWHGSLANGPRSVAVGGRGNVFVLYGDDKHQLSAPIAGSFMARIIKLSPQGRTLAVFRTDVPGQGTYPRTLTVDPQGNLYVATDAWNGCSAHTGCVSESFYITKLSSSGRLLTRWGGEHAFGLHGSSYASSMTTDRHGSLYVAALAKLLIISAQGTLVAGLGKAGGAAACAPGYLASPFSVAVGGSGNIFVNGPYNTIQKLSPTGKVLAFWGDCPPTTVPPPPTPTPSSTTGGAA
jgi:streptogramin lyase